ncbi:MULTISPECIES: MarR family transcriptional regulator [Actinoplanes]|uniref:MarR family winged helix-turn-helix transcriptional regulator n=1 Tax=Actinoplanes TaxID=1865 RepID=UPI0005F2D83B|nr:MULTISPECIES: MarR family transcriptional regulator [Actinoplanes]GLY04400.1 hypothetical protein Acsp01_47790 [Actinoplanes sp. NBRC 101535]
MSRDDLTPVELETWSSLLGVMIWLPAALDAHLRESGLSHSDFQTLWWLHLSDDGTCTMGDLASTASVTPSHLSRIATRLQKQGLMERRPDPRDARFTLAAITPLGRAKVEACLPGYYAALHENLFRHLTAPQVEQLRVITGGVLLALHPACAPASFTPPAPQP